MAQALLLASSYECTYITQLLCTQANGKFYVPTASGFFCLFLTLFGNGSSLVVWTGHLMLNFPIKLLFQL